MGRRSSASSPTGSGTRLDVYPKVRSNYASSDTTLAVSEPSSPASLRNNPPPYGDEAALSSPPQYANENDDEESASREKRVVNQLPKKTLIIRLFTSIFIAFIVCLIVAAVVGRIHDESVRKHKEAEDEAARNSNGTRYTMMVEEMSVRSTRSPLPTSLTNQTTTQTSIARPTGTLASTYSCPYIMASITHTAQVPLSTASAVPLCGLTTPFNKAKNQTEEESIVDVSLHPLKDCVIARTAFKIPGGKMGYRCAVSCSQDGGPGIEGLQDGWKWRCA